MTDNPSAGVGKVSYVALLSATTLGTLSSNIVAAPINSIAADLGASSSQVVLVVSAFTLAMVVFSPVAGWLCERMGAKRFLIASLGLMVMAQVGASLSPTFAVLVAMRALQGTATSAIPPAVQQTLAAFWPHQRVRVMASWASAIGVGQAVGPPIGGVIADTLGWRWIFLLHAALSAVLAVILARYIPAVGSRRRAVHVTGMTSLVLAVGALVGAATWYGQGGPLGGSVILAVGGLGALFLFVMLSNRNPAALVAPRLLIEVRYLRSTSAAATVMAVIGVVIVTVPLYLGQQLNLRPSIIGAVTFVLAASMALFAPVSSRIAERVTVRRVLHGGLLAMMAGPLVLAAASPPGGTQKPLLWIAVALVITGCGVGATQASAAFAVMRSPAAANGFALGIHNMMRFAGLAMGYAWVALTYPLSNMVVVYAGPAALAAATFALTLIGPTAPPVEEDASPTTAA